MSILEQVVTSGPGRLLTKQLGLKDPPSLRRGSVQPGGPILLSTLGDSTLGAETLNLLGITAGSPLIDDPTQRTTDDKGRQKPPAYETAPGALIIDATQATRLDELEHVRKVLRPVMRGIEPSGRVIVLAPTHQAAADHEAKATAEAIEGVTRTVSKELKRGATANLIRVAQGARPEDLASTIDFLLSGHSAFVAGQAWQICPAESTLMPSETYDGRIVVVTGAARGIGRAIAHTFSEAGATVVCVDIPQAGEALSEVACELGGSALQLDITADNAAKSITDHIAHTHGQDARVYAIVHNAGITRDKKLSNLDEKRWAQVIDVNLRAQMTINRDLIAANAFDGEGRIIGVASTSGIAGNVGQANYAASKAGVVGYTRSLAEELAGSQVTANAVAPGFIETDMTAEIPYINREIFRRVNALSQGGRPVDVATTIAYLAHPASRSVNGQVVRVCGHNIVGR